MALITTVEEVKKYTSISKHFDWNLLERPLRRAGKKFVRPLLGTKLYDKLDLAQKDDNLDFLSEFGVELLDLAKECEANYAMTLAFTRIRNRVANQGVQQSFSDSDDIDRPAPVQDAVMLLVDYIRTAYELADEILEYLENHSKNFPDWENDEKAFSQSFDLFIRNTADYQKFVSSIASRQVYLALRSDLQNSERMTIKPLVSSEMFADLKKYIIVKAKKESLTSFPVENYEELITEYIKPLCAYDALINWLASASIIFNDGQMWVNQFSGYYQKTQADERQVEHLRTVMLENRQKYRTELEKFLDANPESFPLYSESDLYKYKQSCKHKYFSGNSEESPVFMM